MSDKLDELVDAIIERGSPTLDRIIAERDELKKRCERAASLLRANQTHNGVSEEMVNDVLGVLYGAW